VHEETSGSRVQYDAEVLLRKRLESPVDRKPILNEILDMLIEDYEARQKKSIPKSISHVKPVREALGHRRVADITAQTVFNYQRQRLKAVSPSTVNRETQHLGQALKLALRMEIISKPIYIRKLSEGSPREDFFEPEEIENVISFLPEYLKDLVRFSAICGWRKTEVTTLPWSAVSFRNKEIRLSAQSSKMGDTRILPITPEIQAILDRRLADRREDCPLIFHRKGQRIWDFRKAWYNATEKAGYAGRVFHSLRRSSARDRIRAGVHERVVMSVNGWKTRAVFDRYNITSTRDAQEALEKTEAYRKSQIQST
jgi:integrase